MTLNQWFACSQRRKLRLKGSLLHARACRKRNAPKLRGSSPATSTGVIASVSRCGSRFLGSHLWKAGPTDERLGDDKPLVDDFQRQRRQAARRPPTDHLCPFLRIVHRVMARALEQQLVRVPIGDVAARMRTYGRVGDDTVDGAPLGLGIEALRVEAKQKDFVEARAVAHRAGRRIHRPSEGLLAVERQVVRFQGLGRSCSYRDQQIAIARPFARGIGLRQCKTWREREADPQLQRGTPTYPASRTSEFAIHRSPSPKCSGLSPHFTVPGRRKLRPGAVSQAASWSPIGRRRMRLPVAAKMALHSAGAKGGSPGSPTPLDGTSIPFGTMCTSVTGGDSSIRSTR